MGIGILLLFYVLGLALLFAELFVPGGILGAGGTILIISSIGFTFSEYNGFVGAGMVLLTLVVVPLIFRFGLSRITHNEELSVDAGSTPYLQNFSELKGQEGIALSVLRPSGMIKIGNQRIDAVAENELIPKDSLVRVVRVEGQKVIVRNLKV
jgi:membrane-bound serine protease (ClpP class)